MNERDALWSVGQVIRHRKFDYRGVIVDVDPTFSGTETWYDAVARSRPPKDRPWYHVLVDGQEHVTYVAERHIEADPDRHRLPAAKHSKGCRDAVEPVKMLQSS